MPKLNCLLILFLLLNQTLCLAIDDASADKIMAEQKAACDKNTAMEWNSTLNRCVGKQAARETRNSAEACNDISDLTQREKCHIQTAEKSTGLSADTSKLYQGKTTGSMVMNGVIAAYTAIDMISNMAKDKQGSSCTSKKIMGVTSVAGLASDIYLKMQAKKKVKELEEKYKLDTKTTAHEAQLTALQYLKEEQQTVMKIASLEKKRNMALMAGYALAAGFAIYEMTPYGQNPTCYQTEETKKAQAEAAKTQTPVTAQASGDLAGKAGAVGGAQVLGGKK